MSNPYRDYKTGFINSLPVGITYNADIGRFYVNGKRFTSPKKAEDYLEYLVKFGFIVDPTIKVFNGAVEYFDYDISTNFNQELGFNANVADLSTQVSGDFVIVNDVTQDFDTSISYGNYQTSTDFVVVVSTTYDFNAAALYGDFQSSGDFDVEGAISFSSEISHGSYSTVANFNRELDFSSTTSYGDYQSNNSFEVVVDTFAVTDEGDGIISVTWTGTLTSITVNGTPYTQFQDGTALVNTHIEGFAGRALHIGDTTGTGTIGQTLTAGSYIVLSDSSQPEPTITIQWQRDGVDIPGATGATYVLQAADGGADVRPTFVITAIGQTQVIENGSAIAVAAPDTTAPTWTSASFTGPDGNDDYSFAVTGLTEAATIELAFVATGAAAPTFDTGTEAWTGAVAEMQFSGAPGDSTQTIAPPAGLDGAYDVYAVKWDATDNYATVQQVGTNITIDTTSSVFDPEAGLTLTSTEAHGVTITSADVSKTPPVVMAVDFTGLDPSTDGMIFEYGANSLGAALFIEAGAITLRAGAGQAEWPATTSYIEDTAPTGDGTLVWEINESTVRMWWNGVQISPATGTFSGDYAGADDGMFFGVHGGRVVDSPSSGFTGFTTASDVRYYEGQTVNTATPEIMAISTDPTGLSVSHTGTLTVTEDPIGLKLEVN